MEIGIDPANDRKVLTLIRVQGSLEDLQRRLPDLVHPDSSSRLARSSSPPNWSRCTSRNQLTFSGGERYCGGQALDLPNPDEEPHTGTLQAGGDAREAVP